MILTDYYRFERVVTKSKLRLDCTASTASYPTFEEKRATKATKPSINRDGTKIGDLLIYFCDVPTIYNSSVQRKATKSITIKGENLSSVFVPDLGYNYAYGDIKNTADGLLIKFIDFKVINGVPNNGAILEIFVARGKSKDIKAVYNLATDEELNEEMNLLREKAK